MVDIHCVTRWSKLPTGKEPLAFVCGPTSFVEAVAEGLGYPPGRVKAKRFWGIGGS